MCTHVYTHRQTDRTHTHIHTHTHWYQGHRLLKTPRYRCTDNRKTINLSTYPSGVITGWSSGKSTPTRSLLMHSDITATDLSFRNGLLRQIKKLMPAPVQSIACVHLPNLYEPAVKKREGERERERKREKERDSDRARICSYIDKVCQGTHYISLSMPEVGLPCP